MNTKAISTPGTDTSCDFCGRTLLRGESAKFYVNGGARRAVCALCTSRAVHEGWLQEGAVHELEAGDAPVRRRSLLSRLRGRRASGEVPPPSGSLAGELDSRAWDDAAPVPVRARDQPREARRVHAVAANPDLKIASACGLFNACEHRRTLAGVARSLGLPTVAVLPCEARPSIVELVVAWELCWYRYEVDLSEEEPHVGLSAHGYELDELSELERTANAIADESGGLTV